MKNLINKIFGKPENETSYEKSTEMFPRTEPVVISKKINDPLRFDTTDPATVKLMIYTENKWRENKWRITEIEIDTYYPTSVLMSDLFDLFARYGHVEDVSFECERIAIRARRPNIIHSICVKYWPIPTAEKTEKLFDEFAALFRKNK